MNDILEDQSKFEKMEKEKDETRQLNKAMCKQLRILKQKDVINSMTFERIRPTGSKIPRLYGLPIRHEIVKHNVNDPYHFAKHVEDMLINQLKLFSLGVTSLFTNVPLKDTIEYIYIYI